jgi:hypothetical protein
MNSSHSSTGTQTKAQVGLTNTERYQQVDNTLLVMLPAITRFEASKANRLICRHFGKRFLGPVTMLVDVEPYARVRVCWLSAKPTHGADHCKGWGRLIHDLSHYIFRRRHPRFRPHECGHATLEREIAAYVVSKGWLEGTLKPEVAAKQTTEERRLASLERLDERLKRWDVKQRRASNIIKRLTRQRASLMRRTSRRSTVRCEVQN